MSDRVWGAVILVGSLGGVGVYFWLLFVSPWVWLTVRVSAFMAVGMCLLMVAWVGYTMATTPPPVPLEEFDLESDVVDVLVEEVPGDQ